MSASTSKSSCNQPEDKPELVQSYLESHAVGGYSANQLNQPTGDDIIHALASARSPLAVYGLLSQFWTLNRHKPLITTDRGPVLYVDFNLSTQKLFLYVGNHDEFAKVYDADGRQMVIMKVLERFDFAPVGNAGMIAKTRMTPQALATASQEDLTRPGAYLPALYIYTYDSPAEKSVCTLRIEWMPLLETNSSEDENGNTDEIAADDNALPAEENAHTVETACTDGSHQPCASEDAMDATDGAESVQQSPLLNDPTALIVPRTKIRQCADPTQAVIAVRKEKVSIWLSA